MRKVCMLSILCIAFTCSLSAQIKKGSSLIGVDIAFNGSDFKQEYASNEIKTSSRGFNLGLLYGKAIKENLFIGAGVSFASSKFKQGNPPTEQKIKNFGGSLWARRYFPVFGPFYAFVNGSLYANSGSNESPNNNPSKTNTFGMGVSVYPGVSLQVKKSFYLDASLNNLANISYNRTSGNQTDILGNTVKQTSSSYSVSTSLGNSSNPLQLGVRWIIAPKK